MSTVTDTVDICSYRIEACSIWPVEFRSNYRKHLATDNPTNRGSVFGPSSIRW